MLWWGGPYTNRRSGHRNAWGIHVRTGCPREEGVSGHRRARGAHVRTGRQDADGHGAPTSGRGIRTQTGMGCPREDGASGHRRAWGAHVKTAQSLTSSRKVSGEGVSLGSDQVMRVGPHSETSVPCPGGMRCHVPLSLCTRGQRPFPALRLLGVSPVPALATTARAEAGGSCVLAPLSSPRGAHSGPRGCLHPHEPTGHRLVPLITEASSPRGWEEKTAGTAI